MNFRSPRILLLLCVLIVLVISIGVVAVVVFQAKVLSQHTIVQKTVIPGNERQVIQMYNQAIMKQDWAIVYATSSKDVIGDASQERFAQMMAQQVQDAGTISSIITTSNPEVNTNPDGIIYFSVHEQEVLVKNGTSHTQSLISIFVLEDGTWKYWFSKKL